MKLQVTKRAATQKSEAKKLRREGFIPAVLYVRNNAGETISVKSNEFGAFLRNVKPGHLPTSIFTLVDETGRERRVIVKDIQYNIVNYNVIHLDFEELLDEHKVNVKIPVEFTGQIECVGIKAGGVLRQVIRHVLVNCYPQHIPNCFVVDIRDLNLKQSKRVSDIKIPETVRPLMNLHEVIGVIVKR